MSAGGRESYRALMWKPSSGRQLSWRMQAMCKKAEDVVKLWMTMKWVSDVGSGALGRRKPNSVPELELTMFSLISE